MSRGPVDVVVVAAGDPRFEGRVFTELERQVAAGTIRVLDAMLLVKDGRLICRSSIATNLPKTKEDALRSAFGAV